MLLWIFLVTAFNALFVVLAVPSVVCMRACVRACGYAFVPSSSAWQLWGAVLL